MKTHPPILKLLYDGIHSWCTDKEVLWDPTTEEVGTKTTMAQAFQAQNELGWGRLLQGFLAQEWGSIQGETNATKNKPKHGFKI